MFGREPVLWTSFIRAVLLVSVLFGVKLSADQIAGVLLVVEAGLALYTRTQVEPKAKP